MLESVGKACPNNTVMRLEDDGSYRVAGRGDGLDGAEPLVLEPLLPVPKGTGRLRRHLLREIMNGIRYVLRYGVRWDAMPKDLPPSSPCYDYWRLLSDGGHIERINHHLVMADREKAGREASPTVAIIDAQSVKCDAPQGERGYDAGKKVLGRKRHIAVDSGGRLLAVKITSANVQDQNGGIPLVKRLVRLCPWIKTVVVDGDYKTLFIEAVQATTNRVVEVVKRPDFAKGFASFRRLVASHQPHFIAERIDDGLKVQNVRNMMATLPSADLVLRKAGRMGDAI